jgi:hypothetical protein
MHSFDATMVLQRVRAYSGGEKGQYLAASSGTGNWSRAGPATHRRFGSCCWRCMCSHDQPVSRAGPVEGCVAGQVHHQARVLRLLGAVLLLLAIAGIHFSLWQDGYRNIPAIGPAFLLQTVIGVGGALLVLIAPRRLLPVAAVLGALFAVGSLGALLWWETFGWRSPAPSSSGC